MNDELNLVGPIAKFAAMASAAAEPQVFATSAVIIFSLLNVLKVGESYTNPIDRQVKILTTSVALSTISTMLFIAGAMAGKRGSSSPRENGVLT